MTYWHISFKSEVKISKIYKLNKGPALMVIWDIATDCKLSLTTAQVWIEARACGNVASDLGLGSDFHWVIWFPPPLVTSLQQYGRKSEENQNKITNKSTVFSSKKQFFFFNIYKVTMNNLTGTSHCSLCLFLLSFLKRNNKGQSKIVLVSKDRS